MKKSTAEHDLQCAIFKILSIYEDRYPEIKSIYSVPNGAAVRRQQNKNTGKWFSIEGNHLKQEGRKAGIPDMVCPYSDGEFSSLYIENKVPGKSLTPEQKIRIPLLEQLGNRVAICYSSSEAIRTIFQYTHRRYTNLLKDFKTAAKLHRDMGDI